MTNLISFASLGVIVYTFFKYQFETNENTTESELIASRKKWFTLSLLSFCISNTIMVSIILYNYSIYRNDLFNLVKIEN